MPKPLAKLAVLLTPKRRWAQFSLGTMFVVVTVICVWLAVVVNRANRQREAVTAIEALHGGVTYDGANTLPKRYLRQWLPKDYTDEVVGVEILVKSETDLRHLRPLKRLKRLRVDASVFDTSFRQLLELIVWKGMTVEGAWVTDDGLAHLHGLARLEFLSLGHMPITDAGLKHLHGLAGLRELWLGDTLVTNAGVVELQKALPNCWIDRADNAPATH